MVETAPAPFRNPAMNIYSHDVMRLVRFYASLGFRETFRTPDVGTPVHVELTLDGFTMGIASVAAAVAHHGLSPDLGGHSVEIVLWTDDTDRDYAHLTAAGALSLSPPHDFLANLRAAWVADPDGNPIQLVQHRCAKFLQLLATYRHLPSQRALRHYHPVAVIVMSRMGEKREHTHGRRREHHLPADHIGRHIHHRL